MRLETTAGKLHAALSAFRGVIERRNTIPVLGFDGSRLTGTDLDTALEIDLPTIGKADGEACVDYFGLAALASHIDADTQLVIGEADGLATVEFGKSQYRLTSLPASDFPTFDQGKGRAVSADNMGLVHAMRRIRFAISREETRYYLNGVAIMDRDDGHRIIVATDGHRLAYLPLPGGPDAAVGKIIPSDVVHYLVRRMREPVSVSFDPASPRASFELGGGALHAKLIDGTFPDVFRVIPKVVSRCFSVDRKGMLRTLNRMRGVLAGLGALKLEGKSDGLHLSFDIRRERSGSEIVSWAAAAPEPFTTGFNVNYLISALSELTDDVVHFSAEAPLSKDAVPVTKGPGHAFIISGDTDPLRIVQMPMRV